MSTSLYINRAHSSTNAKQVKEVFKQVFQEDLVKTIDVLEKKDNYTGETFKAYFIHFNKSNAKYDSFITRVMHSERGIPVIYDSKEHYWYVSKFVQKTKAKQLDSKKQLGSKADLEKRASINLKKIGGGLPSTAKYEGGHIETWSKPKAKC
jgi:hypothetical protein